MILSCGFMADGVRAVLGDGSGLGIRLRYVEEPKPLGTGGALKFAEELLDERFLMLNGDVLTDIDLTAQLAQHERTGARATLALIPVEDPSAYGLVRANDDGSVREFVEKPGPEQIDTNLINAGAYVLERDVLEEMAPAGTNISIERDVFPGLVGDGLFGFAAAGYWLDIGTPRALPAGDLRHPRGDRRHGDRTAADGSRRKARRRAPRSTAGSCRRCSSARAAEVARGGDRRRPHRARARRDRRRRVPTSRARWCSTARASARTARSAPRSSGRA